MEHVMARRSSLKQCEQYRNRKPHRVKKKKKNDLAAETGTGACEFSPALSALEETQNIWWTDIVTAYAISRGRMQNANGR